MDLLFEKIIKNEIKIGEKFVPNNCKNIKFKWHDKKEIPWKVIVFYFISVYFKLRNLIQEVVIFIMDDFCPFGSFKLLSHC